MKKPAALVAVIATILLMADKVSAAPPTTAATSTYCSAAGSFSRTLPPYATFWFIGQASGVRYWHITDRNDSLQAIAVVGCDGANLLWSGTLWVTSTSGDRCDSATSSTAHEYVGEHSQWLDRNGYLYRVTYRYWHMRRLDISTGIARWVYDHSELARC